MDDADYYSGYETNSEELDPFLVGVAKMTDPVAKKICSVLASLGSPCYCHKIEGGAYSTTDGFHWKQYYLTPGDDVTFASIATKSKDLLVRGCFNQEPSITAVPGSVLIEGNVYGVKEG